MITEAYVWTIFFLPIIAFVINSLIIRPFFNRIDNLASGVLIVCLSGACGLSLWTLITVVGHGDLTLGSYPWINIGGLEMRVGLMVDSLTAVMLVVVTAVSLAVQVYSVGYMKGDPSYTRYFSFMALFTAAMLGLVLSSNIIQLYVMWELVGLGSYLLIGFWHYKPKAAAAAKKAFIVTRIGDFGFLLAILYLFFNRQAFIDQGLNPLEIADINAMVPLFEAGAFVAIGGLGMTWLALGIFAGAVGKSAQFPLHVWLPDAMEGPTPVSALIHAATMVAAGVFLVARFFPVFEASETAMIVVALVGGGTAILAATIGIMMNDIKRVLAYSTISQLGYMIAALGIGAYGAAIFHLFNHAFFKALLFLGAGNVNHSAGTFDMRYMGGLRHYMPVTYFAMLIGSLSLVGIFPLSGFWSKDEILHKAWFNGGILDQAIFWILILGVFLTGIYTFRMIYLTFHGKFRGGAELESMDQSMDTSDSVKSKPHLAESPLVMLIPMGLLAIAAIASGVIANSPIHLLNIPVHWFTEFMLPPLVSHGKGVDVSLSLAIFSVLVGLVAIGITVAIQSKRSKLSELNNVELSWPGKVIQQKYYMDHLYEQILVKRVFYRQMSGLLDWFDRIVVDNFVDCLGWIARNVGWAGARIQSGQVQTYAMISVGGLMVIFLAYWVWG